MVIDHFETFVSRYDSRYRETYGKLRDEAQNAFLNFRRCGDPNFGITLFRCDTCDVSLGVPFTCKARVCVAANFIWPPLVNTIWPPRAFSWVLKKAGTWPTSYEGGAQNGGSSSR